MVDQKHDIQYAGLHRFDAFKALVGLGRFDVYSTGSQFVGSPVLPIKSEQDMDAAYLTVKKMQRGTFDHIKWYGHVSPEPTDRSKYYKEDFEAIDEAFLRGSRADFEKAIQGLVDSIQAD